MNRDQKAAVIDEITGQIESAEAVFAVDYRGISVPQVAELRTQLRAADTTFRVVKNSLTERAADRAGAEALKELLEGPTALAFVRGDAAVAAKALADYGRATELLAFKGGLLGGSPLDADQIRAISRLPAKDVLHAQLVGMVAAPISGLVRGLNALIAGLAIQLGKIAEQGLVGGAPSEAPAEAEAPAAAEAEAPAAAEAEAPAAAEAEAPAAAEAEAPSEGPGAGEPDQAAEPKEEAPPLQPDQAEGEDQDVETENAADAAKED